MGHQDGAGSPTFFDVQCRIVTAFPTWMYRDPAEAVERIEGMELRAEARERLRQLEREQEAERMQRSLLERMGVGLRRVICAPPEVRLKRARIQALVRAALKARK